jgi:hypothetical protein
MTRARFAPALASLCLAFPGAAQESAQEPAQEPTVAGSPHFEEGSAALRSLARGSSVTLTAPDGSSVAFRVEDGELNPRDYHARAGEDSRSILTPGGYRIEIEQAEGRRTPALAIRAPSEATSYLWFSRSGTSCSESDGRIWQVANDVILLFLPDGTRIDLDRPARVVQVNAGGSAWRMGPTAFRATREESPALEAPFFLALYQTGDGDDWSRMADAALMSSPWKDMPRPLAIDDLLQGLQGPPWSASAARTLSRLPEGTAAEETAGYLLASYFSQPPGSRVRFEDKKGRNPRTVFILPGTMSLPREGSMRTDWGSPTVDFAR